MKLWLDFETRSMLNLKEVGLDRYAKDQTTEALMLAWAVDDNAPSLWQPRLEPMPVELAILLNAPAIQKCAWNYNFEKDILEHCLGIKTHQDEWYDPSITCAYMSLPIGLHRAGEALEVQGKKIHITGDDRPVKLFSVPTKATKKMLKNGQSPLYFKNWDSHPADWQLFCDYCVGDVISERAIHHAAVAFGCPMTLGEQRAWLLDQRMNETGVWIDQEYVTNAKNFAEIESAQILAEIKSHTGLDNPNSGLQLKGWFAERGYVFDSLDKAAVDEALLRPNLKPLVKTVLELKKKLGGSAYKKFQSIIDRIGPDGRLRDQFVYHGAHTARWSGRGVQLQNLFKANKNVATVTDAVTQAIKQNILSPAVIEEIVAAYNLTDKGKKTPIKPFTMMQAVAGTVRSSFAASPNNKLVVGDLAQIESRVLAALAGCQTMIDAYASGLDLYKDIMSFLLEKPYNEITSGERANGKVIILGCGFGMGWEKFISYAASFGITLDETTAKKYVNAFREKYKEIPEFWEALNSAVIQATKLNICSYVKGLVIDGRNPHMLKIKLPCGRALHYLDPQCDMVPPPWGGAPRDSVSYMKFDLKGAVRNRLYGGLICENVVQAVARDLLLNGMEEAEKKAVAAGGWLVMTIHDEIVIDTPIDGTFNLETLIACMTATPAWAEGMGFIIAAEGWEGPYYRK